MTRINPLIFRAYDIRGIAMNTQMSLEDIVVRQVVDPVRAHHDNDELDLTEETMYVIGKGTGTYLRRKYGKNIVIGHDNRLTSPVLQEAFISGLKDTGCYVSNVGLSTSPMIYWATCAMPFDAGVNITASHNPKEYNGVKIVGKGAHSICGDELQEILKVIQNEDFDEVEGKIVEKKAENFSKAYMDDLLSKIQLKRKLKIVVDAGNATTGKFAPMFFRKAGCEVTPLYCDLDGTYPNHEANPEEEKNMRDLAEKVHETGADLGIAFDGDGDRVGIVDENGRHYSADLLLLLLARDVLSRHPNGKIVFDVKASRVLIDDIRKHGGVPVMSKTGHSFIEARMKEERAFLGGEVSGHMFFAEDYYGFDDAFLAALKILEILSKGVKPFSKLFEDIPQTFATPEFKARCPDERKFNVVKEVSDYFTKKYDCITIDGVRVNFDEYSWGAVRCSNTSPNLTLRFESQSEERLKEIQSLMADVLKKYPEVDLSWYEHH